MTKTNPDDLAFSDKQGEYIDKIEWEKEKDSPGQFKASTKYQSGLTKREWFAGLAMGAAMQYAGGDGKYKMKASDFAQSAVAYADALIAELAKEKA